jgi:K+-transporting ATPase ATPase B chain
LDRTGQNDQADLVPVATLNPEDVILVESGDIIPADGEVIEGIAAVDEHILTGSHEPVVRMVDTKMNAVSAGTQVQSGQLIIALKARPRDGLRGRMFRLARGKEDTHQSPNFLLNTLTAGAICLTLILALGLLIANHRFSGLLNILSLLAVIVAALIPLPTAGLLSLVARAGNDHLMRLNFVPVRDTVLSHLVRTSVLLLDKNDVLIPNSQQAVDFVPTRSWHSPIAPFVDRLQLAHFFGPANANDQINQYSPKTYHDTPSTTVMAGFPVTHTLLPPDSDPADAVPVQLLHGGPEAVVAFLRTHGISTPPGLVKVMKRVISRGGQPLVVTQSDTVMGVLHIQQRLRAELKSRIEQFRRLGIQTILVSEDAPSTTATLAAAIGADDFLASATEASVEALVKQQHNAGQRVLLTGHQPRDTVAFRLAHTAVAPGQSAYPAREAADAIDLDSNPIKIFDLLEAGHQWQMTRRALTVLAGTSDLVKFIVIGYLVLGSLLPALYFESSVTVSALAATALAGLAYNFASLVVLSPLALGWLPFRLIDSVRSQRNVWVACMVCGLVIPLLGLPLLSLVVAGLGGG